MKKDKDLFWRALLKAIPGLPPVKGQIARILGISRSTIGEWEAGKRATLESIRKIQTVVLDSEHSLSFAPNGYEMLEKAVNPFNDWQVKAWLNNTTPLDPDRFALVPLYSMRPGLGFSRIAVDGIDDELAFKKSFLLSITNDLDAIGAMHAVGDSMCPIICDNDLVLVDRSSTALYGCASSTLAPSTRNTKA